MFVSISDDSSHTSVTVSPSRVGKGKFECFPLYCLLPFRFDRVA